VSACKHLPGGPQLRLPTCSKCHIASPHSSRQSAASSTPSLGRQHYQPPPTPGGPAGQRSGTQTGPSCCWGHSWGHSRGPDTHQGANQRSCARYAADHHWHCLLPCGGPSAHCVAWQCPVPSPAGARADEAFDLPGHLVGSCLAAAATNCRGGWTGGAAPRVGGASGDANGISKPLAAVASVHSSAVVPTQQMPGVSS
jgi:hypothetical protein